MMASYMEKWALLFPVVYWFVYRFNGSFCDGKDNRPVHQVESGELVTRDLKGSSPGEDKVSRWASNGRTSKLSGQSPPFCSCWATCTQSQVLHTWSTHVWHARKLKQAAGQRWQTAPRAQPWVITPTQAFILMFVHVSTPRVTPPVTQVTLDPQDPQTVRNEIGDSVVNCENQPKA